MRYSRAPENDSHDELMEAVAAGSAAILSDGTLPGGRFQVSAVVMGGEFVLTSWRQDERGDWSSGACILLKHDAATRLVELLHTSGYARPLRKVEP